MPQDKQMKEEAENKAYDIFIRNGLAVGFTDDQVDFLWDWINEIAKQKALGGWIL